MGTIMDKLNYLKETIQYIDEKLLYYLSPLCKRTLKEKIEYLVSAYIHVAETTGMNHFSKTITDEIGTVTLNTYQKYFIPPEMPKTFTTHALYICQGYDPASFEVMEYVDISKLNSNSDLKITAAYNGMKTLKLPDNCCLQKHTFRGANYLSNLFSRGIIFDGSVLICKSDWISTNMANTSEINIINKNRFSGNLYLSKFNLSTDTMVNFFENLDDLTKPYSSKYTLNIGTTNLAKLTEEQKNIATNKGWKLT